MLRLIVLAALCVFPAIATRSVPVTFTVHGAVYLDNCQAGFETSLSRYLSGAKVKITCSSTVSEEEVLAVGETKDGKFHLSVHGDYGSLPCYAKLMSCPDGHVVAADRSVAPVFLTTNNGIASTMRFANNLACNSQAPMSGCVELLKQYQEDESLV